MPLRKTGVPNLAQTSGYTLSKHLSGSTVVFRGRNNHFFLYSLLGNSVQEAR